MLEIRTLLWLTLFLLVAGCNPSDPSVSNDPMPIESSKRPPLKIWLIDVPELEKEMGVRWQAASDQPIHIENFTSTELVKRDVLEADVFLYPGFLMGELIHRDAIGKLPAQALEPRNATIDERPDTSDPATRVKIDRTDSWPLRWRTISTFAGQRYAMPLGASSLTAVINRIPTEPLTDLDNALSSVQDLNSMAAAQWKTMLEPIEELEKSTVSDRQAALNTRLASLTPKEKDYLVDRFLWIANSTEGRRKGLFDLVEMQSRIHKPEFIISARVLGMIARLFPEPLFADHTSAWTSVVTNAGDNPMMAIGRPDPTLLDSMDRSSDSGNKLNISTLTWNPNQGIVASIGKKTRQTSVSCQFVSWLSEPEQREAFRSLCPNVELLPGQTDRNGVRDDYRDFQRANNRDTRGDGAELSLRLVNANQYRTVLAECLIESIRAPEQTESILRKCTMQWDELTKALGVDDQRISQEKSLGYRK